MMTHIITIYVDLIKEGLKTLDQVPLLIRGKVQEALKNE